MRKASKDYYRILGVPPAASEDDIKRAYRRLARKHHPDVASNRGVAEETFKEINEAHEVLSNPARRRSYDAQRGTQWHETDFRACSRRQESPPDTRPFRDGHHQDFGFRFDRTERRNDFDPFVQSPGDQGRGGFGESRDHSQHQTGVRNADMEVDILVTLEEAMHGSVRPLSFHYGVVCEECAGIGRQGFQLCRSCDGNGRVIKTHNYRVRVPAGVRDGQRLKLAGNRDWSGAHDLGGDLYLRVRLAAHPHFRVQDGALHYDLVLGPMASDSEATAFVPTLNGRVLIKIPSGIRDGQTLRVRNQGLPQPDGQRGDLFIVIRMQTTENTIDDKHEFRERTSFDTSCYSRR